MSTIMTGQEKKEYSEAERETDNFFEKLRLANGPIEINGVRLIDREQQNFFALCVMEALKSKEILLLQAGVGIGKSIGYLIPIFYTYKNVKKFQQILISTSTIALQDQLLEDIDKVAKMLGIKLKVQVIKGIKNYACQRKISDLISYTKDKEKKNQMQEILKTMIERQSADRSDLGIINQRIWDQICLESRGICSNCSYAPVCNYQETLVRVSKANIVVTNHAYLSNLLNHKDDTVMSADAIVIDEAHKLEENIRSINEKEISLSEIKRYITAIRREVDFKCGVGLQDKIVKLYKEISENVNKISKNNSRYKITRDNQYTPFNYSKEIKENLNIAIMELKKFITEVNSVIDNKSNRLKESLKKKIKEPIEKLENIISLFEDMASGPTRNNIYWVAFPDKHKKTVTIHYTPKKVNKTMGSIYSKKIPIIFTSGTMADATGGYNYFREGIGLNEGQVGSKITEEIPIPSSYDFSSNSLVYYDPTMISPKFNGDLEAYYENQDHYLNYITSLASEISKLILLTEGKALILFTSKQDMELVYTLLNKSHEYPFKLLLQKENNADEVKNQFVEDTNSCLFATGTFWEGIDIKGKSLSNLIICRLPFPSLEPLEEYKASQYSEENRFQKVYLKDMINKLKQGTGRLIRGDSDTGIICCLDPRFKTYLNEIQESLEFQNYTTDFKELEEFVQEKIIPQEERKSSPKR